MAEYTDDDVTRVRDLCRRDPMADDLTWVEQTMTVDAEDPAKRAIEDNPGWRLLHVGMGKGGQTTLTYGWPWPAAAKVQEARS